ncbi:MAG: hypothetical protein J0H61_14135, partial [Alphaproteobacteria bacterium]|nr:hypothetical protein [Alphaproteobacteria bacterium]
LEVNISRRYVPRVYLNGRADDKTIVLVRQELGEIASSLKSPIWWCSTNAVKSIATAILVLLWIIGGVIFIGLEGKGALSGKSHELTLTLSLVYTALVVGSGLGVGFLLYAGIDYLFPAGVYLIGDEIGEDKARAKIRNLVFVGIILAFVISVLSTVFTNRFA